MGTLMVNSKAEMRPIVSKMFCSPNEVVLEVRTRPHVIGGGGFVVTDSRSHQVVFRVDGCGVVGKKDHITIIDVANYQTPLLLIRRRKGGIVEALSLHKQWGGYTSTPDYYSVPAAAAASQKQKLVFTLKDPKAAAGCLLANNRSANSIRVDEKIYCDSFQIRGNYYPDRECSIVDSRGNIIAQVGVNKEMKEVMEKKDVYQVVVKPGIDQAFVVGVIAILDYIHNGSTTC